LAVVFLEGGLSPIPMHMASTKLNRGPRSLVCQFVHCRTQGLANLQTQFVAESQLFSVARDRTIAIAIESNRTKITMATVKTNKLETLMTPKERGAGDISPEPSCADPEGRRPRPAARSSRLVQDDHGSRLLGGRHGKVSLCHDPAHVLVGIFACRQPKPFGAFLTHFDKCSPEFAAAQAKPFLRRRFPDLIARVTRQN
jgi:hypothetical protein